MTRQSRPKRLAQSGLNPPSHQIFAGTLPSSAADSVISTNGPLAQRQSILLRQRAYSMMIIGVNNGFTPPLGPLTLKSVPTRQSLPVPSFANRATRANRPSAVVSTMSSSGRCSSPPPIARLTIGAAFSVTEPPLRHAPLRRSPNISRPQSLLGVDNNAGSTRHGLTPRQSGEQRCRQPLAAN